MLNWFNATAAQAFGKSLAQFYVERVPAASTLDKKKFATKTQETLRKMDTQVQQFRKSQTLNVYQRAKLGNAFKWALREGGYETGYVDELTEWLMLRL